MYKIEKGIEVAPEGRGRKEGSLSGFLRGLKVGDSFLAPEEKRGNILTTGRKHGVKLVSRLQEDGENVRIWRVRK
jgi:hypothetical protein